MGAGVWACVGGWVGECALSVAVVLHGQCVDGELTHGARPARVQPGVYALGVVPVEARQRLHELPGLILASEEGCVCLCVCVFVCVCFGCVGVANRQVLHSGTALGKRDEPVMVVVGCQRTRVEMRGEERREEKRREEREKRPFIRTCTLGTRRLAGRLRPAGD